ncbi:MAG: hypothetical protein OJF49_001513 [Ktedonobacterales bacterium]|jgi:hypothetical protein|nr:MAG: hypothetical protein OJF49_001513 [Ktedonobacterales bacterium]
MWYRVVIRKQTEDAWETYGLPTPHQEILTGLLRQARTSAAVLAVIQAENPTELRDRVRLFLSGSLTAAAPVWHLPPSSAAALPPTHKAAASAAPHILDARRWEIERGAGGDHDQPYRFELPQNPRILAKWIRLFLDHSSKAV